MAYDESKYHNPSSEALTTILCAAVAVGLTIGSGFLFADWGRLEERAGATVRRSLETAPSSTPMANLAVAVENKN